MDTKYIKLTGKAEIPDDLEIGMNIGVAIDGTITSKTESDNNDGSHTKYYKFEPVIVKMVDEKGKVIHTKDIRKWSQKMRSALWKEWNNVKTNEDFDIEYYPERMRQITTKIIEGEI